MGLLGHLARPSLGSPEQKLSCFGAETMGFLNAASALGESAFYFVFGVSILPSIFGSSAVSPALSLPARRASSVVRRSAAFGCMRPRMSDILPGAIFEANSYSTDHFSR